MSSISEVRKQEQALLEDATSIINTLGPMALPMILFVLCPGFMLIGTGVFLNALYNQNPPLVYGWNPGWLNIPFWELVAFYYTWIHYKRATRADWHSIRYWMDGRYFDNDFKLDHWEQVGKTIEKTVADNGQTVMAVGVETATGFKILPGARAGELFYECHLRSKKFPVYQVTLPDVPERLITTSGNVGMVIDGGLMFEVEHIAGYSFVRTDFTKTETVPFVPIGILTDYSRQALEVAEGNRPVMPSKEAIQVMPKVRDTFYASEYFRKWQDEKTFREKVEDQQVDIDQEIDNRAKTLAQSGAKVRGGITRGVQLPGTRKHRGWVRWVIAVSIIVAVILVVGLTRR